MSPDFERLIGRAILDEEFRKRLLADLDEAIKEAGFNLTEDEMNKIREAAKRITDPDELKRQLDAIKPGDWQ